MNHRESDVAQPVVPPYFDVIFDRLEAQDEATTAAFGRHVHWGYWPRPEEASGTAEDYARAAEALCCRLCDAAEIADGMRILDVGCGFGGTIASLNERYANLELVGVNIDERQLTRARQVVRPQNGNRIRFEQADACQLRFPPGTFDRVLAVECIFHFPDRLAFFGGAARALVHGGKMALSDFVPPADAVAMLEKYAGAADKAMSRTYGHIDVLSSLDRYRTLATQTGLELAGVDNISKNTLPTYPFLRKQFNTWPDPQDAHLFNRATARLESSCHMGLLDYSILTFRKKAASVSAAA